MPEHQQTQQSKKTNTIFQKQATPINQTPVSNPYSIIQRAKINPKSLTHADVMQLQRTIGNRAVGMLLTGIGNTSTVQQAPVQRQETHEKETCSSCMQRQEIPKEEESLQGKMIETVQRQEIPEEEEPLQGKMIGIIQRQEIPEEEEPLQGKMAETIQLQEIPEEEESLQGKMIGPIQCQEIPEEEKLLQTKRENNTGMPDNLKAGVESLSGMDMSDVRVHYNSDKPANVGALAYTQGTDIHVAPGQERHLPHEAWHVVQQKQGRVQATTQMKGLDINDDPSLEHEADMMGAKTVQLNELAYTQGTDIHVRPGQERHLPHEAWHVVQQAQNRVKQTIQMKKGSEIETELERGSQEMSKKKISDLVQKKTDGKDLTVKYDNSSTLEDWEGTTQRGNEIHFLSRHGPANSSEGYLRGRIIAQIDLFEQYRGEKIVEENRRIDTISGRAKNRGFDEAEISGEFGEFAERDEAQIQMNAARENIRKLESIVSGSDEMFAQLERWARGEAFKDRLRNSYHGSGVPSKVASSFKRVEDMEQAAYAGIAENLDKLNGEINNDADPSAFPDKFKPVRVNQNIDILAVQMRNGIEIVTNRVTNVPVTLYYVSSQNAPDYTDYTVPLVVQTGYPEVPDV